MLSIFRRSKKKFRSKEIIGSPYTHANLAQLKLRGQKRTGFICHTSYMACLFLKLSIKKLFI